MSWDNVKSAMLFTAIGGVVVMALIAGHQRREVERLKTFGDSVQAAVVARDSAASAEATRSAAVIDSLQLTKQATGARLVVTRAARDSLARALAAGLASAHDTIVNQAAQIVAQDSVIAGLESNAKVDSLSLWVAMQRGDRLLDSLHAQTAALVALNAQVQRLNQHTLPKWLRVSFDAAQKGLAVYGLVTIVRGK